MLVQTYPLFKRSSLFILTLSFLFSCCSINSVITESKLGSILSPYEKQIDNSQQIVLVHKKNIQSSEYLVYLLQKHNKKWNLFSEPMNASVGRNGVASIGKKREGDGKTPAGIFSIKHTFGYNASINTKMPYRQVLDDDLWIDDPKAPDYNKWVKKTETSAKSFEKMKRSDEQYKYGIIIEYNTDPIIEGHGSAIFMHVWKGKNSSTAGCVAVSEKNIIKILSWLDPDANPMIIIYQ
ncbi:MAG: L,D-transpeptidase family protein [Syntrophaceae bacterium]|nr:L,D-transpeptidase family protein [Syntrophaceae bacterium]